MLYFILDDASTPVFCCVEYVGADGDCCYQPEVWEQWCKFVGSNYQTVVNSFEYQIMALNNFYFATLKT